MKSAPRPAPRRADRAGGHRAAADREPPRARREPPAPGPARPGIWHLLIHPALWSAIAALILYAPVLSYGFAWDDHELIVRNPLLARAADLPRLLTADFWAGTGRHTGFWRPLISLSYWIDTRLFAGAAGGFHALNVLAHASASALVALLLGQAGLAPLAALVGGVWFALLPAHVESVASVSGRTDVYAAAFLLFAFWLDRRARRSGRPWCGWGALLALALALLSKESAIVFAPLVAIAEWTEAGRSVRSARAIGRWLAPALVVSAVYLIVHALLVPPVDRAAGLEPGMAARVRAAAWLEFPGHLAFLWPWVNHAPGPILRLPDGFWNAPVIAACLLQLGAVAGLFVLAARRSALAVPAALIVLPMLPLTLLALVRGELLFAERFVYVSSAGAAWLVAAAVGSGLRVGAPEGSAPSFAASGPLGWAVVVVAGVLTLGGGQRSAASLPMWRDDRAVFGTMVRERPENPVGQVGWARLLLDAGRLDESERNARAALELNPRTGLSYLVLGWIAIYRSEWDRALALADSARTLGTRVFEVALVRGTALARLGRYREAAVELEPLGRLMPDDAGIQAEWGRCLFYLGRNAEALAALDRAHANASISMNPEFHFVLGQALARAGERREARSALERAVDLEPAFEEGWLELARACDALGDGTGRDQALARAAALPDAHRDAIDSLRRGLAGPATGARRSGAGAP